MPIYEKVKNYEFNERMMSLRKMNLVFDKIMSIYITFDSIF